MERPQQIAAPGAPLRVEGELTISGAVAAKIQLLAGLDAGGCTLDLSGVTHFDGAGLQLLLLLRREADLRQVPLGLVDASPAVRTALGLARIGLDLRPHAPTRAALPHLETEAA